MQNRIESTRDTSINSSFWSAKDTSQRVASVNSISFGGDMEYFPHNNSDVPYSCKYVTILNFE
jgi:hypothetical protein